MLKTEGMGKNQIAYMKYIKIQSPHGHHIFAKAYDMAKATIYAHSQLDHALPHWKCVLRCCAKYASINLPEQETDDQCTDTSPSIHVHVYHLIARCTKHGRLPLTDRKFCRKFQQYSAYTLAPSSCSNSSHVID